MEPTVIYDKSLFQSLARDEADWFGHFFRGVITPVFLSEMLGNLAKDFDGRMDPAQVVAAFADKAHSIHMVPNASHVSLIEGDLLGYAAEMNRVPIVGGGQRVVGADGKTHVFFDEPPEAQALRRWSQGDFQSEDREVASSWRAHLKTLDLSAFPRALRMSKEQRAELATLQSIVDAIDLLLNDDSARFRTLNNAFQCFDISLQKQRAIKARWVLENRPPLRIFAPYAYFSLRVTMVFLLGVTTRIITERPTNLVDLQYLYYLPFCMVFTSGDKLHRDLAPLFLRDDQCFIWARDLKGALAELIKYYSGHADELRAKGRVAFARYPPLDLQNAITKAYDIVAPRWREDALEPEIELTPEMRASIMEQMQPMLDAIARARGAKP